MKRKCQTVFCAPLSIVEKLLMKADCAWVRFAYNQFRSSHRLQALARRIVNYTFPCLPKQRSLVCFVAVHLNRL